MATTDFQLIQCLEFNFYYKFPIKKKTAVSEKLEEKIMFNARLFTDSFNNKY